MMDGNDSFTVEKIAEILENGRKSDEELSDDDRDLLEDFMEFLNQKQKWNGYFICKKGEINEESYMWLLQ